ncbi:MAG: cell wall hydrolase [Holosporaceae bacterium]|nr:cell wall hydrolase [Holosporaceae bacterium]
MNFTKNDLNTLAKTIYGEARGELYKFGIASLIAIANVIVNRKEKNFAKTITDVCTAPHQFSCWNREDVNYEKIKTITEECSIFRICLDVAQNVLQKKWPDLTDGCDHYHERFIKPFWAAYMEPKRIFGSHYFYELKRKK